MTTPTRPETLPLETLGLMLEAQTRALSALGEGEDLSEALSDFCRELERHLDNIKCAIMLHEHSAERLKLLAAPSLPESLRNAIDGVRVSAYGGSAGAAVLHRQPVFTADIKNDPRWRKLRDAAAEDNLRACWSTPLLEHPEQAARSRDILGSLDFYFSDVQPEEARLAEIMQQCATVVALVLRSKLQNTREVTTATLDPLTGLPHRDAFWSRLRQLVEERKEDPSRFAVAVVDIDQLKDINDTLGFKMGDLVLQAQGERLHGILRRSDTVARIGGDEFGLLIQDLDQDEEISVVAQRIKEEVTAPYEFDGHDLFLTGSVGLSVYPWDGMDEHSLLRNAETALQHAKERGGSDYQLFRPTMVTDKPTFEMWWERSKLGSELRHVLERDELELHYQLKYQAGSQKVCGAEALIRWNHPSRGQISPARFIPMAEQTGVIIDIGEWVIETACRQHKKWQDSGLTGIPISVNVSPQQFRRGRLVERITSILEAVGLPAKYLELEITESLAMEERGHNLARMQELHSLGLPISIDDFGTGFSSLSYLTRFPIDTLKIDQSFVRNLGSDQESEPIVRAIISMAQTLSLKTVAEGVETQEQYDKLCEWGCDIIQGYYFCRPLPVAEVTQILIKRS